jgi:hypothetical protein
MWPQAFLAARFRSLEASEFVGIFVGIRAKTNSPIPTRVFQWH